MAALLRLSSQVFLQKQKSPLHPNQSAQLSIKGHVLVAAAPDPNRFTVGGLVTLPSHRRGIVLPSETKCKGFVRFFYNLLTCRPSVIGEAASRVLTMAVDSDEPSIRNSSIWNTGAGRDVGQEF